MYKVEKCMDDYTVFLANAGNHSHCQSLPDYLENKA